MKGPTAVILLLLLTLLIPSIPHAEEPGSPAETADERIAALRKQAMYAEALDIARESLTATEGKPDARPYEIGNARRLVATLEYVSALPDVAQHELAVADSLAEYVVRCISSGRYLEATEVAEKELEARKRILGPNHVEVPSSMLYLANGLHELGRYSEAESLIRRALVLNQEMLEDQHEGVSWNLNDLAYVLEQQGKYLEAEPLYRDALKMDRYLFGEDHEFVAMDLNNIAYLLQRLGHYEDAGPLYREALDIKLRIFGDEHPEVATGLDNLGFFLRATGDWAGAEVLYRQALLMRRKLLGDDHPLVAKSLNNVARVLTHRRRADTAREFYLEALDISRRSYGEEHPEVARLLNNLASVSEDRSEELRREALKMLHSIFGGEHPMIAMCLGNLGNDARARGDFAEAERLYKEALDVERALHREGHPHYTMVLCALGAVSVLAGDEAAAESYYTEALDLERSTSGSERIEIATPLKSLGNLCLWQGQPEEAVHYLHEAAEVGESARLGAWNGIERVFADPVPYPALAVARLLLGRGDDAWLAAEKHQGRVLADLLLASGVRPLSPTETTYEDSLRREVGDLERQAGVLKGTAPDEASDAVAVRADAVADELLRVETEFRAFIQEMASKYPVEEGQIYGKARIQSSLSAEQALVGWVDARSAGGDHESWGYVMRDSGPVTWARLGAPSRGDSLHEPGGHELESLRRALANPHSPIMGATLDGGRLWNARLEPLLGALSGVKELVVVPSGDMLGLPLEALVDSGGICVGDRFVVSYVPSGTIHAWLTESAPEALSRAGTRSLFVGDPMFSESQQLLVEATDTGQLDAANDYVEGSPVVLRSLGSGGDLSLLPRLTSSRVEILSLAATCPQSTTLLGRDASEQELDRLAASGELDNYSTVHVATHAIIDNDRPEESGLVLSQVDLPDPLEAAMAGARVYDGVVTAKEIMQGWSLDADLVTLSACETGLGVRAGGEGYIGLAHAFLQVGARSVLVSLWKVEDAATSLLMRRFYENRAGTFEGDRSGFVGEPMPKAAALRDAKMWLRNYTDDQNHRPYEHPYYWSSFVLIGDST